MIQIDEIGVQRLHLLSKQRWFEPCLRQIFHPEVRVKVRQPLARRDAFVRNGLPMIRIRRKDIDIELLLERKGKIQAGLYRSAGLITGREPVNQYKDGLFCHNYMI